MKRCSTSLVVGKMQIKTEIRYYFMLPRSELIFVYGVRKGSSYILFRVEIPSF